MGWLVGIYVGLLAVHASGVLAWIGGAVWLSSMLLITVAFYSALVIVYLLLMILLRLCWDWSRLDAVARRRRIALGCGALLLVPAALVSARHATPLAARSGVRAGLARRLDVDAIERWTRSRSEGDSLARIPRAAWPPSLGSIGARVLYVEKHGAITTYLAERGGGGHLPGWRVVIEVHPPRPPTAEAVVFPGGSPTHLTIRFEP